MMGTVNERCAHIAAALNPQPLRVVTAHVIVIPGEDHITALFAPLAQQIGVPLW